MSKFADELLSKFPDVPAVSYAPYSVGWIVQRVIDETRANPSMKQHGETHLFTLRRLQVLPIGAKDARKLTRQDIIEFAKSLRATVKAATVAQYVGYLGGALDTASATWDECSEVSRECIRKARPFLQKNGLIGKSEPRKVRPAEEQLERLEAYFDDRVQHGKVKLKRMGDLIRFSVLSSRRRGELCRMTHGDVDYERRIYWVRDMKHPTKKKGNDKFFILTAELEAIIRRQPRLRPDDPKERIWPYSPPSVTQAYIAAKKALGITGIRLHDNRAEAISRALLKMPPEDVRVLVSGHDNTRILEKVYDRRDALSIASAKYPHLLERT